MLGVSDPVLLDFLYQTFDWNPKTRVKSQQALEAESFRKTSREIYFNVTNWLLTVIVQFDL